MKAKIVYMALALALVFSMVAVMVPVNPASAQTVIFSDDFEYDDSLENHGWTIEASNPQGYPQTATDPENHGNRAAHLVSFANTGAPFFSRSFCELPLQPGMKISIKFYDTGDSCGNCDVHTYIYFDDSSSNIYVGWYNSPSNFYYGYDISGSWSGHLYEPHDLRGIGWHTFTWRVEQNGGIDLLIDDYLIIDDLMGVTTLSKFRIATGSDPYTYSFYVDDFSLTGPAPTVCLDVDGEGLADGTPIPGWNLDYFGGPPAVASVTATDNPVAIHSGSRGVHVNGDYEVGKELDYIAKGIVTVDWWHYPQPGPSTNSKFRLLGGSPQDFWWYVGVWKNDQDLWWVAAEDRPSVAVYSGNYTHIVITIDTCTGLFDLNIDEQHVYNGTVDNADKIGTSGIRYVVINSGRGGSGTDSYLDDILITATETETSEVRIAFQSDRNGNYDIYSIKPDGSDLQPIIVYPGARDYHPVVSPDGTRLAFTSNRSGNNDIWVFDFQTKDLTNLTADNTGGDGNPTWSPDGEWIAFASRRGGYDAIWKLPSSGGDAIQVTFPTQPTPQEGDLFPDWSHKGNTIVFQSTQGHRDHWSIYEVDVATGVEQEIIPRFGFGEEYCPAYSPDDTLIAWTHYSSPSTSDIWIRDTDDNRWPITSESGYSYFPDWSPDGTKIAFDSNLAGRYHIYMINADGSGTVDQITDGDWNDYHPNFYVAGLAPTPTPTPAPTPTPIPGEGCFIATAAYNTSTASELDTLRAFRDEVLLQNSLGSQLVEWYYQVSPPVADFISEHDGLRTLVRELLVEPIAGVVGAMESLWRN